MTEQSIVAPRFRISRWSGEFLDSDTEAAYARHAADTVVRQFRVSFFVSALLIAPFLYSDLAIVDAAEGHRAAVFRVISIMLAIAAGMAAKYFPVLATSGVASTLLTFSFVTGFFRQYFALPPDDIVWAVVLMCMIVLGTLLFIPNRFRYALAVACYGAIGTAVCVYLAVPTTVVEMVLLVVFLLMSTLIGAIAGYRSHVVRRLEYAAIVEAEQVNAALEREIEERQRIEAQLQHQATTDPLTKLHNRRHYEMLFAQEMKRARRTGEPLSLCVFDLDHFKAVNDTYGHLAGDAALKCVADLARQVFRPTDIIGRLGGEEFVIMLPHIDQNEATALADRLRKEIESAAVSTEDGSFQITATFGVAELLPEDADADALVRRADEALYEGKRGGRNRVVMTARAPVSAAVSGETS